jgi:hypothetical protein
MGRSLLLLGGFCIVCSLLYVQGEKGVALVGFIVKAYRRLNRLIRKMHSSDSLVPHIPAVCAVQLTDQSDHRNRK